LTTVATKHRKRAFGLVPQARLVLFGALVGLATAGLTACGDGVGNPIRLQALSNLDASAPAPDSGPTIEIDAGPDVDTGIPSSGNFTTEDIPSTRQCRDAAYFPVDTSAEDAELLALVDAIRSGAVLCGSRNAPGAAALIVAPELNCSARLQVLDMENRSFFDQVNPDGLGPADRIAETGYSFGTAGEVIAHGSFSDVVTSITSSNHACSLLLDPGNEAVGIGHLDDLWVIDLAGP